MTCDPEVLKVICGMRKRYVDKTYYRDKSYKFTSSYMYNNTFEYISNYLSTISDYLLEDLISEYSTTSVHVGIFCCIVGQYSQ